jgi:hypothetical protein
VVDLERRRAFYFQRSFAGTVPTGAAVLTSTRRLLIDDPEAGCKISSKVLSRRTNISHFSILQLRNKRMAQ